MRDMTIGQFYNTDSVVHRLDPRVKIAVTLIYVVTLFVSPNPFVYLLAAAALAVYIRLSHVPLRFILQGLKALWMILIFTMLVNLFTIRGGQDLFHWRFLTITYEGVRSAVYLGVRLALMMIGSGMMTYTTTPNALTDGLEKMLGWMRRLRVPVHEFAMIMSIALRFIPVLVEELDKIMKAQTARGVDFSEGNLVKRLRKLMPILIPLFVSAIRRSNELALAMDARCYHGGEGRTRMKPLRYQGRDYLAYCMLLCYFAAMMATAHIW